MRRPNLRFIVTCIVIVVVVVFAAHIVHGVQTKRTAKILLLQARQLRDKGDLAAAAGYYQRYVQLSADDTEALAEYGFTLADSARAKTNAIMVLEQVLRRDPNYPDVRRRLVDLDLKSNRYSDAKVHLQNYLLKEQPRDGQLWYQLGQCQESDQTYDIAIESYRKAIECKPDLWEAYLHTAVVLRKHLERSEEADKMMNSMVEQNAKLPDAYYARSQYWIEHGHPEKAMADAEQAVALNDQNVRFLLYAATIAQELKNLDKAEDYAARAMKVDNRDPKVYLVASQLALLRSNNDKAIELLKQGLTARPNQPDLLWELGNLQIERRDFDAARKTVKNLFHASNDRTLPDFLDARIQLQQGDVLTAVARFEKLRSQLSNRPDLQRLNDFSLGLCYDRMGYPDQKVAAYRRAVEDDPQWIPARWSLAAALASSGQIDEAVENYQRVAKESGNSAPLWQEYARSLVVQQLRLPKERRDWKRVQEALDTAARLAPDAAELAILRAELLVAQDQSDRAAELLATACLQHPDVVEFWVTRAALALRQGKADEARKSLDEAEAKLGDRPELRLERIRETMSLDRKVIADELAKLEKGWDQFPSDNQFALARRTASIYTALGDTAHAEQYWNQAIALRPEYLPAYLLLFDTVVARKDQKRLSELLQQIEHIEGRERGPLWCYGEAARRILLADTDKSELAEARTCLAEALVQRPRWARALVLMGDADALDGNLAAAMEHYQAAVDLGERNPTVIRNLIVLLYKRQRFTEADQLLRKLESQQQAPFSPDLERLASEVSWRTDDLSRALELGKKAAENAKTVDDYLWLGQLQTLMNHPAEAEQAFRTALQVAPQELRAWQALVQHEVRQNAPDAVERTLQDAAGKIPPERIAMIRAQALTALKKPDQAADEYERAMQINPNDGKLLASAAEFFLVQRDLARSETLLRKLLDPSMECTADERIMARRQLALVLANGRQFTKVNESLLLLERNEKESPATSSEDQRVKAVVMAAMPGHNAREQAINILEKLAQNEAPQPGDHFLLAQMYEAEGRWPDARHELQRLIVSVADTPPMFLAAYIRALLDHNELHEAKMWLTRWQNLHPDESDTAEFQAEIDVADKKFDDAAEIIMKQSQKPATASGKPWAADMLETLAFKCKDPDGAKVLRDAAERAFRDAAQQVPRRNLALADFLARQGRYTEAVDLCLNYASKSPENAGEALLFAVGAVCQPQAPSADRQRVEQLVRQRLDEDNHQPHLATAMGTLYESQARYPEAINAYRQALQLDPNDVVALNNIGLLLAHQGNPQQAITYLKQALTIAGPRSDLLDSQGSIRLSMGDNDGAIADFTSAISDKPSASRWLHLAAAQFHAHHNEEAQKAYDQALAMGLTPRQVHPFDQPDYAALNTQFAH